MCQTPECQLHFTDENVEAQRGRRLEPSAARVPALGWSVPLAFSVLALQEKEEANPPLTLLGWG